MSYELHCECGKAHIVDASDAGASLRCGCGREVEVPPLHALRASSGEEAISPALQIQAMLLRNELPGTRACACCRRDTDRLIQVSVRCESVTVKNQTGGKQALAGCLVGGLLGGLAIYLSGVMGKPVEHGREVSFVLPLRLCEVCDHETNTPAALRTALSATPVYAALLDQYPNATITRTG